MVLQYLTWNGVCPECCSKDIAMISQTRHNEHWGCICGNYWMVPIEESIRASTESGVRCFVDELIVGMCQGLGGTK